MIGEERADFSAIICSAEPIGELLIYEQRCEKNICENKDADQLRDNREADQRLCFRYTIVQFLYFLNPKFQVSSNLWLYSPVCARPGRKKKPEDRFSQNKAHMCPSINKFEQLQL